MDLFDLVSNSISEVRQEFPREWITKESLIFGELDFSSIDLMNLFALLHQQTGKETDYNDLLFPDGQMREDDLSVAELVRFIDEHKNAPDMEPLDLK